MRSTRKWPTFWSTTFARKGAEAEEKGEEGQTRRSDVLEWYLTEVEEIEDREEAVEKKQIIEKVLDRLSYQDNVLIPLSKAGLKGDDTPLNEDPILLVHPNYVSDE